MQFLDEFTAGFFEAMAFTDSDEWGDDAQISAELDAALRADCRTFWACFWQHIPNEIPGEGEHNAALAGHDFWLTRNGHGAGFWDGDWTGIVRPEVETAMDTTAKSYRVIETYVGDDGRVYA